MNNGYVKLVRSMAERERAAAQNGRLYPVSVGIVDTGAFPHMDIRDSIIDFHDCVGGRSRPYDDNGHGTHIAGIVCGTGAASGGKYRGIYTGARLAVVKGLDEKGGGSVEQVTSAIDYLIKSMDKYNIRVINISMGGSEEEENRYRPLLLAVEEAWNRGITVCAASGNSGPGRGSVTVPGTSRKVITVGASDDHMPVRTSDGGVLRDYSGRGPTRECIVKPDVLCAGTDIISCKNSINGYVSKSGTSMSTAAVAGIAAFMLSMYPDMTPKDVKQRLINRTL